MSIDQGEGGGVERGSEANKTQLLSFRERFVFVLFASFATLSRIRQAGMCTGIRTCRSTRILVAVQDRPHRGGQQHLHGHSSLSLSLSLSLSHSVSLSFSHTHAHRHTLFLFFSFSLSLSLSLCLSLSMSPDP